MGQGGTSSMHPHRPRGDTALPQPREPPGLVPGKLRGEQELPPPLSRPQGQRGGAGAPAPLQLALLLWSEQQSGREGLAVGRGGGDMSEAKDPPSEGGLMSLGRGKEGAAVSGQPGRWCQQRRGLAPAGRRAVLVSESKHCPFQGCPPSPEPAAEAERTHYSSSSRDWGELLGEPEKQAEPPCLSRG